MFVSKGTFMSKKSVRTVSRDIHQFHPDGFVPWTTSHAWRTFKPHLISLNIFDLDPRVALPKTMQVIWWHQDLYSIRRSNECVLKSVGVIKKSFNDIP